MKNLVLYHANCNDGFGAAMAAWLELGDNETDYQPVSYGESPPDCSGYDTVYLVDFCYPVAETANIASECKNLVILDHHKTAIENVKPHVDASNFTGNVSAVFDDTRSGAAIAWQYFRDEPIPPMYEMIQDRDLWKFELLNTKAFHYGLSSYPKQFEVWASILSDINKQHQIITEGQAILRVNAGIIAGAIKDRLRFMSIGGHNMTPVINMTPELASDTCHELLKADKMAATYVDGPLYRSFSLRTAPGGPDASKVAAHYGGGGHLRAAGFRVDNGDLAHFGLL